MSVQSPATGHTALADNIAQLEEDITADDLSSLKSHLQDWEPTDFRSPEVQQELFYLTVQAAQEDRGSILSHLLSQGAKMDPTLPYLAADKGSEAVFQVLLDHGWDINTPYRGTGATPVTWFIPRPSLIPFALSRGADTTIPDRRGTLPLEAAAVYGPTESLKHLLAGGASPQGTRALHAAAASKEEHRVDKMTLLLEHDAEIDARVGHVPARNEALKAGGEETALHAAIRVGNMDSVRFLVLRGASKGLEDWEGRTALQLAQQMDRKEALDILKEESM